MAGKFVTILNPGYSTLYTRDLAYTAFEHVDGSTSANVFNPDASHPLQEGEWLTSTGDGKLKRAASDAGAYTGSAGSVLAINTSGSTLAAATTPCFMNFQERGRYDAQLTRKAHVIMGPSNFEFRTKQIICAASGDEGKRVVVMCCIDTSGRHVAALVVEDDAATACGGSLTTGAWYAGVITRVHGQNDATVLFQPGY
jgi:hypothetical protein